MVVYIIMCILIVLLAVCISLYVINSNKFQVTNIKIKEAEDSINFLLSEKYKLLTEIEEVVKNKIKDHSFESLENININEIDSFTLNKELSKYDKTIIELSDYNKDVKYEENELELFENYANNNVQCIASEKYYNDNVAIFNRLVNSFPSKIIAKFKKYKIKDFYSNEKEEIFEIMKN